MLKDQGYRSIESHGVLLNNRTAALVSTDGTIDFACFPNFDSLPTFVSLLDSNRGGFFSITPLLESYESRQEYEPDTNVLRTNFHSKGENVLTIIDFLPMTNHPAVYFSEIHRMIKSLDSLELEVTFAPFLKEERKDFKEFKNVGYLIGTGGRSEFLATDFHLERVGSTFQGKVRVKPGEEKWLVAAYNLDTAFSLRNFSSERRLRETRFFWKDWLSRSKYQGIFYESVNRSLLLMKGLFFEPTGFMVASPTTSLPETIGGGRNWDYRYIWIRDTAFVIEAMTRVGYIEEAMKFYLSIIDRYEKDGRLFSVYSINDAAPINEIETDLSGYLDSRPVRYGNAAYGQLQIDQFASLIHGLRILMGNGGFLNLHALEKILSVGNLLSQIWREPDSSIWEIRGPKKNYVYSKVAAWRAFKDLSWLSSYLGMNDLSMRYEAEAKDVKDEVNSKGISKEGYYSQSYGSEDVDASLLRLPLIGFSDINDPTYSRTLDSIVEKLMREEFFFKRYTSEDGLGGDDNAFLMLSFWYIRNLIIRGDLEKAFKGLNKIIKLENSLGLLPEEIDFGTKRYLGNYPQALSHLSLILAVVEYDTAIHKRDGYLGDL